MRARPLTVADLIDLHEAAGLLDCSTRTVRRLVDNGELSGYQLATRKLRVDRREVLGLSEQRLLAAQAAYNWVSRRR